MARAYKVDMSLELVRLEGDKPIQQLKDTLHDFENLDFEVDGFAVVVWGSDVEDSASAASFGKLPSVYVGEFIKQIIAERIRKAS